MTDGIKERDKRTRYERSKIRRLSTHWGHLPVIGYPCYAQTEHGYLNMGTDKSLKSFIKKTSAQVESKHAANRKRNT